MAKEVKRNKFLAKMKAKASKNKGGKKDKDSTKPKKIKKY